MLLGALTGMGFGAVLYKVGATRYSRIMGMLTLRDTKVMKFTFVAIATASLLYGLAGALGVSESLHLVPRVMPFFGLGHALGGAIFGLALGFTGNCPGTCAAKAGGMTGANRLSPLAAVFGLVAGVFAYAYVKEPLMRAGVIDLNQRPMTLHGLLGLPYPAVALVFGALMAAIAFLVDRVTNEHRYASVRERRTLLDYVRGEWSWLACGVLGGVLVVLATAQNGYLGFSGAILAAVGWGASLVGHPLELVPHINSDIVWRAALILGAFPGGLLARALSLPSPEATAPAPVKGAVSPAALGFSFTSGAALALGALIGGGCTTGAYLAGWPTLSVGSFAMGGTFFAASMLTANLRLVLRRFDLTQLQAAGARVYD
jgi:hypothetical protein